MARRKDEVHEGEYKGKVCIFGFHRTTEWKDVFTEKWFHHNILILMDVSLGTLYSYVWVLDECGVYDLLVTTTILDIKWKCEEKLWTEKGIREGKRNRNWIKSSPKFKATTHTNVRMRASGPQPRRRDSLWTKSSISSFRVLHIILKEKWR